jgi:hypothetical protein
LRFPAGTRIANAARVPLGLSAILLQQHNAKPTMQKTDTTRLKNILDYLPERIKQAIEEYCTYSQLSPELVIELAIAHFLDVDSVTFDDCQIDSPGKLREQNKILKIQLAAKD